MKTGAKMDAIALTLWLVAIGWLAFSLLWFLFGTTAFFQRGIDLVETILYIVYWAPVLIFTLIVLFVFVFKQDWLISHTVLAQRLFSLALVPVVALSVFGALQLTPTAGWLTERVMRDVIQVTSDEKYEYRVELVNNFQKNEYVRLYVKDISTGDNTIIRLNMKAGELSPSVPWKEPLWSIMSPTEQDGIYLLSTLDKHGRPLYTKAVFEINMITKTSTRID